MNIKSFLLGLGVGIVGGIVAKEVIDNQTSISAERALAHAKAKFKELGPISGSWIQMNKEAFVKDQLSYEVYRGGISRLVDEQLEQYEFVSDSKTGTILEVKQLF